MTLLAKSQPPGPLLADYRLNGFFDEMFGREGGVLRHYEKLWSAFSRLTPEEFATKRHAVDLAFLRQGVTFNVYGDSRGAERVFPFDLMPRIIPAKEWELIERGLIQRITALNLFLHDIYHEQKILKDGVIPEFYVLSARHFRRMENFRPEFVLENRLETVMAERSGA